MDMLIEGLIEIILECFVEGIIPASIPHYTDNRKERIGKAIAAIIAFIFVIVWSSIFIAINNDYRAIMLGIFIIIVCALSIILIYLRAKGISFSLLYSLNFIVLFLSTCFGLTESIVFINTKEVRKYGFFMLAATIIISMIFGTYTAFKIKRYNSEDKKVKDIISNKRYNDDVINALDRYKTAIKFGHLEYYNLVHGSLDELKLIKSEIPVFLYETTKKSFSLIDKGESSSKLKINDSFVKIYEKNIDRYIYRLVYIKYNYFISKKQGIKEIHPIIKDNIYDKPDIMNNRLVVRGIIENNDHKFALLKIEADDLFGHRDHYETPGGGVEENESLEFALKREILEELGCKIEIRRCIGYIDIEYNLLSRVDRCIFYHAVVKEEAEPTWSENEKKLIKKIVWLSSDEIKDIYKYYEVANVGKMIHERDKAAFNGK